MTERLVLVRTPNWLGDTVMALPALAALRESRPAARITAVGSWTGLLAGQEIADVLLAYPRKARARWAMNRAVGVERADLAVLLPYSIEAAIAATQWGARRIVGFACDGRDALLTDAVPLPDPRRHQVDEYACVAAAAGAGPSAERPRWRARFAPTAETEVESLLESAGIGRPAPGGAGLRLVGLHLGATGGSAKQWMPDRVGQLAAQLREAGMAPLLIGTREDARAASQATISAGFPVPSLVGQDRAELLPALLRRLACLVSGDTGVAHLAAALEVPTVTLFGPTDPRLTAPRGPRARAMSTGAPCAPCFLRDCPIDHICLRGIAADEVAARVLEVVA